MIEDVDDIQNAAEVRDAGELSEPRWAVIGAGDRTVRHLTYEQAVECRDVLDAEGIFGLCIVTDETAERILNRHDRS